MTDKLAAVAVSDIHLTSKAPICRLEQNWLKVQKRYLTQLYNLTGDDFSVPIIFAGDLFDKPTCQPELINWCIDNLPEMYGVPGQHDLPLHVLSDMDKSAFGTMVKVGRIKLLRPNHPVIINKMVLWGWPWNTKVTPCPRDPFPEYLHIAVIHAYIWTKKTGYLGAPEEKILASWEERLQGYDIAIFGDNHHGFLSTKEGKCKVLNNGTFMRRKMDEIGNIPSVGLIYKSGKVVRHYLDTSKDQFAEREEKVIINGEEISLFLEELNNLDGKSVDFPEVVKRSLTDNKNNLSDGAKKLILEYLNGEN